MKFFLDCADVNYLKEKFGYIQSYGRNANYKFLGITTNPRIMQKAGVNSLKEYKDTIHRLCQFLEETGDSLTLWVQPFMLNGIPDTKWIEEVVSIIGRYNVRPGIKVAPWSDWLNFAGYIYEYTGNGVNVTGLTTAAQALFCLAHPYVEYVSIIPGRMEEAKIDPYPQMDYIAPYAESIIAGSIRSFSGLEKTASKGFIPTIGNSVLDMIQNEICCKFLFDAFKSKQNVNMPYPPGDPIVDHLDLSQQFFRTMDDIALPLHKEFLESIK